jgi:hypothetical protein
MKIFPLVLITAATMLFTQNGYSQGTEVSVKDALTDGQRDLLRGDLQGAKERFEFVLKFDPSNVTAKNYLHTIETQENSSTKGSELEKTLGELVIPHVQLKEATFGTSLEYLKQTADKLSNGKTKVNFVVAVPQEVQATKTVTLDLTSVPFTAVLHYITEQTGLYFTIDKYAITVKQEPPPTPAPAVVPENTGTDAMPPSVLDAPLKSSGLQPGTGLQMGTGLK